MVECPRVCGKGDTNTSYDIIRIDSSIKREVDAQNYNYEKAGDAFAVLALSGTASVIFDKITNKQIPLSVGYRHKGSYTRFWIVNAAQGSAGITLYVGHNFEALPPTASVSDGGSGGGGTNTPTGSTTPTTQTINLSTTAANVVIPNATKVLTLFTNDLSTFDIAFNGGSFITIPANTSYTADNLNLTACTLQVIGTGMLQILSWS